MKDRAAAGGTNAFALAALSTPRIAEILDGEARVVVLLPVGSVEPHGPHLPLCTDTIISESVAVRAAERLVEMGFQPLIAPPVPYGVTEYARGFRGAVSVSASALTPFLRSVIEGFLVEPRVAHLCVINNHLEPAHDAAVRASVDGLDPVRASVASPLVRRWARTLSDEFKKGECHAGSYETSIVLAARPDLVDERSARALPDVHVSLSEQIKKGVFTFGEMGMAEAYSGSPRSASDEEGRATIELLAAMVVGEVTERVGSGSASK